MTARVVVVGDVIDDVVVRPHGPISHSTDTPATITPTPGGSGANQAAWLAWAGARVRFAGRVGAADVERHAGALRAAGVEPALSVDPARPTGTIVILVDETGERTMLTDRGANLGLTVDDLPDRLLDHVDALHLSGYSLFDPAVRAPVLDLARRARQRRVRVSVDPCSAGFLELLDAGEFLGWVAGADLLLPNLAEAQHLTGCDDAALAAVALLDHVPLVVVTMGKDGATVAGRGEPPVTVPAPPTEVVDSTGAGDAFTGAFLAAWLAGSDLVAATRRGVAAGMVAVGRFGGRPPATNHAGPDPHADASGT